MGDLKQTYSHAKIPVTSILINGENKLYGDKEGNLAKFDEDTKIIGKFNDEIKAITMISDDKILIGLNSGEYHLLSEDLEII